VRGYRRWFRLPGSRDPQREVSAHYLIARDGRIYYLVDELARAWHAGESAWGGNRDLNSASIGIELDNNGEEPYAEAQIAALLALLADLTARWSIPAANVLGHGDVAPGRKVDPGALFPWRRLAAAGFGLWCDPPYDPPPAGLDDASLLAALGYDVSVPWSAAAVMTTLRPSLGTACRRTPASQTVTSSRRPRLPCGFVRRSWRSRAAAMASASSGSMPEMAARRASSPRRALEPRTVAIRSRCPAGP